MRRGLTMPVPPDTRLVAELVERARPIFAGQPPEVVGAALADLTAIWLASHVVEGSWTETDALRGDLMLMQVRAVRRLTAVNSEELHGHA